tara:strand:- start:745 stop:912 length:168 start_codon:yes stop_codon:yes gene_type:complete
MQLLITEATEIKIRQVLEQASKDMTESDPGLEDIINEIEDDLDNAERIEGDIYVY